MSLDIIMHKMNLLRRYFKGIVGRKKLLKDLRSGMAQSSLKVVIGSGNSRYDGWISTD